MVMEEVKDLLKEIEDVTEINGCFLLRSLDNAIIESTIPMKIPNDILWEISVLRDTFQQFSSGFDHGSMNELMLQGDKGFIFIYNLTNHFILLLLGPKEINLPNFKLGLFDIIKRFIKLLEKEGQKLLTTEQLQLAAIGEGKEILPTLVMSESDLKAKPPVVEIKAQKVVPTAEIKAEQVTPTAEIKAEQVIPTAEIKAEQVIPTAEIKAEQVIPTVETKVEEGPTLSIESIINSIKTLDQKSKEERLKIIEDVFNFLKNQCTELKGSEIGNILLLLKDAILENLGSSLALFDITKQARELKSIDNKLIPAKVNFLQDRIKNWVERIISK